MIQHEMFRFAQHDKWRMRGLSGFTLIELSIVLVILGLIVGGIVGGRSLIQAARIQSLVRDYNGYLTAYNAFNLQYDAKPGDMKDAWEYFGGGVNTICGDNNTGFNWGCNGNGDGILGYNPSGGNNSIAEQTRAWMHLQLADIVPGKVHFERGVTLYQTPRPTTEEDGVWHNNVPQAKGAEGDAGWGFFNPMSYSWHYTDDTTVATANLLGKTGHWLMIGAPFLDNFLYTGALYPKDASNIDKKLDDGLPHNGNVVSAGGDGEDDHPCDSNSVWMGELDNYSASTSRTYNFSNTRMPTCILLFYIGS